MKKNYYLFMLMTFLTVNLIQAQFVCPELLGPQSTTTSIVFKINSGSCANYADNIFVSHQGVGVNFAKVSCNGTNLRYDSTGGALPDPDDFQVSFPNQGLCQYQNGVLVSLSDEETSFNDKVLIYPNPITNGDKLTIKFKSALSAKLEMYNVTGKLVYVDEVSNQDGKEVDTRNFSNGIYMLKISSENASTTRKVVIMK